MKIQSVKASEFPPALNSDYCPRCMRPFRHKQMCALVTGGPSAKYREIGIEVCTECILGPAFDQQDFLSVYLSLGPFPLHDPERLKPRFMSNRPIQGFLKLSLLDNGLWRVGLHRGHAEIWSAADVDRHGSAAETCGFRYSPNYELYGPPELITDAGAHTVIRVEFLDLRAYVERRQ